ncbi:MAG TPA: LamG-like jellyroll fold domain-containing protein [Polyangia bacterium]
MASGCVDLDRPGFRSVGTDGPGVVADATVDAGMPPLVADAESPDVPANMPAVDTGSPPPDVAKADGAPDAGSADTQAPDASPPDAASTIPGLIAHWTFDEQTGTTAHDKATGMHNGTLRGNPTWLGTGAPLIAPPNGALRLSGGSDGVSFSMVPFARITVSAWIRLTQDGGGMLPRIVSLYFLRFYIATGDGDRLRVDADFNNLAIWRSGGAVTRNAWHHVAVVFDATEVPVFYIDGVPQSTTVMTAPVGQRTLSNGPHTIGNRASGFDRGFAGDIDDLRIYDVPLTRAQIAALARGG